jgi:hypothetical protein
MICKESRCSGKTGLALGLAVLLLILAMTPALAHVGEQDSYLQPAAYQVAGPDGQTGVLGREGGALGLLGVGEPDNESLLTVMGVEDDNFSLSGRHNGWTATWVVYSLGDSSGSEASVKP